MQNKRNISIQDILGSYFENYREDGYSESIIHRSSSVIHHFLKYIKDNVMEISIMEVL